MIKVHCLHPNLICKENQEPSLE